MNQTSNSAATKQTQAKRSPHRLGLSVAARNFDGLPVRQSLARLAEIGFDTCDNFDWRNPSMFDQYLTALPEFGLSAGVLVVNKKPDVNALGCGLVLPEDRTGFRHELELCIDAAHRAGCQRLEVLTGNAIPNVRRSIQMDNCVAALESVVPLLEANGMIAVVELLNSTVDHPDYFLNMVEEGVEMIDRVSSPHVKLLFDVYHVQVMQGNLIQRIRNSFPQTGQYHFADVPGRHEPGTGEINFRNVFKAIYDLKYEGFVTAEYHPTVNSFTDLETVRDLATFAPDDKNSNL